MVTRVGNALMLILALFVQFCSISRLWIDYLRTFLDVASKLWTCAFGNQLGTLIGEWGGSYFHVKLQGRGLMFCIFWCEWRM